MLKIITLPVGQLTTNCYLVYDENTRDALVIDPGDDAAFIINKINDAGVTPKLIVATHGHFDHIMAVYELCLANKIPFWINRHDEFLVKKMPDSVRYFLKLESGQPPIIHNDISEGKNLSVGNTLINIYDTPGHTPGSISLYIKDDNALFSGDLMFSGGGIGRSDFSYSDKNELIRSVRMMMTLPAKTIVYPGHGPSFNLGEAKEAFS